MDGGLQVEIQSSSLNHVDVLVKMKDMDKVRVTGFYGYSELGRRGLL